METTFLPRVHCSIEKMREAQELFLRELQSKGTTTISAVYWHFNDLGWDYSAKNQHKQWNNLPHPESFGKMIGYVEEKFSSAR